MLGILRYLLGNIPAVIVILLSILLFGYIALVKLPVDLFPEIEFPSVAVGINYLGASPEEIEDSIAKILEGQFLTIPGVKSVITRCFEGFVFFIVQFDFGANIDLVANDVREKIDFVSRLLPRDSSKPQIFKFDPSILPIITIGVTGLEDITYLREIAEDSIAQKIYQVDNVANVSVEGGYVKKVFVELDDIKLNSVGISPTDVLRILGSENQKYLSGYVLDGYKKVNLVLNTEFKDIEDIKNTFITFKGKYPLTIRDVADVNFRKDIENAAIVRINGQDGILISVTKKSGANTVKVSEDVKKKIEEIKKIYPNLNFNVVVDQGKFIVSSIENLRNNALYGAVLAVLVVFLFLVKIKETILIGIAIPFSLIVTFAFMYFLGISLNVVSLTGLAIAVGLLVDNCIVVIESIYLKYRQGKNILEAAFEGTKEVYTAIFASSLTTVIIFLPITFTQGLVAQLFRDFALTASISILSSLFVSVFIVPPLYSRYWVIIQELDRNIQSNQYLTFFSRWLEEIRDSIYNRLLIRVLDLKKSVLVLSVFIVLLGSVSFILIGKELLPVVDASNINLSLTLPPGTYKEITKRYAEEISKYLLTNENVKTFTYTISGVGQLNFNQAGERGGRAGENVIDFSIRLKDKTERKISSEEFSIEIRKFVSSRIPGKFSVNSQSFLSTLGSGANVELNIFGKNVDELEEISSKIMEISKKVQGVQEVNSSTSDVLEDYTLLIDKSKLGYYGISGSLLGNALKTSLAGSTVSFFKNNGKQYEIVVQLRDDRRKYLDNVLAQYLQTPIGNIPLADLIKISNTTSPRVINRENNNRKVSINIVGFGISQSKLAENVYNAIKKEIYIPPDITIKYGGSFQELQNSIRDLLLLFSLAFVLVYSVMVVLFKSFKDPFIIIFSVPYGVFMVLIFFFLLGLKLNIISIVGLVLLLGIVVNNGIVMVDYMNQLLEKGYKLRDAVIEGAKRRFRPIMMTSLTTIIGVVPLSLGIGSSSEIFQPLGQVVLIGLSAGVIFTIFVIPIIFEFLNRKRFA
ncbi:MAG: efflux RND transporter permease subunit [Brevinematia bacterium]